MSSYAVSNFLSLSEPLSEDQSQLLYQLTEQNTQIANAVNGREIAIYDPNQVVTGKVYYNAASPQNRLSVYRVTLQIPATSSGSSAVIAHGVSGLKQLTMLYGGVKTDVPDFRPVPYIDVTNVNKQISAMANGTNISITVGSGSANVVSGWIVMEYTLN